MKNNFGMYCKQLIKIQCHKNFIKDKLIGHNQQQEILLQKMKRTIREKQNSICMILGKNGIGKSMIIEYTLNQLKKEFNFVETAEELDEKVENNILVIRIDGLMFAQHNGKKTNKEIYLNIIGSTAL